MFMDNIKIFAKHEKELGTMIQKIRIYSKDIRMEFHFKFSKLKRKSGKREPEEGLFVGLVFSLMASQLFSGHLPPK